MELWCLWLPSNYDNVANLSLVPLGAIYKNLNINNKIVNLKLEVLNLAKPRHCNGFLFIQSS